MAVSPLALCQLLLQRGNGDTEEDRSMPEEDCYMEMPEDLRSLEMPEDLMREMCLLPALSASPSPSRSTSASPP